MAAQIVREGGWKGEKASGIATSDKCYGKSKEVTEVPYIEFGGKRIEANEDGFVVDPQSWTREVAEHMAHKDGLNLTDDHWEIINYLRKYFQKYEIAPMIKILVKEIGRTGPDKGNILHLYRLFPDGPAKQACRYAGLPKATGCL